MNDQSNDQLNDQLNDLEPASRPDGHHSTEEMRRRNRWLVIALVLAVGIMLAISTLVGLGPT